MDKGSQEDDDNGEPGIAQVSSEDCKILARNVAERLG